MAVQRPDKSGNAVIDTWLAAQGRAAGSFNPVERLCYIGTRGMSELGKALLGSTATKVLHISDVPVLLVK